MIHRTAKAYLWDNLGYSFGGNARDVWEFEAGGLPCRVVNEWRSGARLLVEDVVVAENNRLHAFQDKTPALSAVVTDGFGRPIKIEVYVRAVLTVKINVSVDGKRLSEKYV